MRRRLTVTGALFSMLMGLGLVAATQTAAQAHPDETATFEVSTNQRSGYIRIDVYLNNVYAGSGFWSQDPGGDLDGDGNTDPGDAIIAHDATADGWGIETHLSTGREASTRGYNSPYWSDWATGNLAEGTALRMWVCLVRGDSGACSPSRSVYA